jgi:hypothetical protein
MEKQRCSMCQSKTSYFCLGCKQWFCFNKNQLPDMSKVKNFSYNTISVCGQEKIFQVCCFQKKHYISSGAHWWSSILHHEKSLLHTYLLVVSEIRIIARFRMFKTKFGTWRIFLVTFFYFISNVIMITIETIFISCPCDMWLVRGVYAYFVCILCSSLSGNSFNVLSLTRTKDINGYERDQMTRRGCWSWSHFWL